MNKNSFFSFSRFGLLLRNDFMLNYKKYLLTIAGAFLAGILIIYINMPSGKYGYDFHPGRYGDIFVIFLIGLGAFIGLGFPAFSNKASTHSYLLMPCSTFEKFASQFLIRIIIGTALIFLIFYVDAIIVRSAALHSLSQYNNPAKIPVFHFSDLFFSYNNININIVKYTSICLFITLGLYIFSVRLYYKRLAMIKTALTLAATAALIALLCIVMSHLFYPETKGMDIIVNDYQVFQNISNMDVYMYTLFCVPIIFFLPLGYFKLKEKHL
jgi:hypothetical protein